MFVSLCQDKRTLAFVMCKRTLERAPSETVPLPSCPPFTNLSSTHLQSSLQDVAAHPLFLFILIVVLGHLRIHFSLPLHLVRVFSASDMCAAETHQTARKGGGSMWSLAHILPRRPLCWRRCTRSVCLACVSCVWERVCVRVVLALRSPYLWVSEEAWQGSRWVGVGAGQSCKGTSSGPPSSPKLLASGD